MTHFEFSGTFHVESIRELGLRVLGRKHLIFTAVMILITAAYAAWCISYSLTFFTVLACMLLALFAIALPLKASRIYRITARRAQELNRTTYPYVFSVGDDGVSYTNAETGNTLNFSYSDLSHCTETQNHLFLTTRANQYINFRKSDLPAAQYSELLDFLKSKGVKTPRH